MDPVETQKILIMHGYRTFKQTHPQDVANKMKKFNFLKKYLEDNGHFLSLKEVYERYKSAVEEGRALTILAGKNILKKSEDQSDTPQSKTATNNVEPLENKVLEIDESTSKSFDSPFKENSNTKAEVVLNGPKSQIRNLESVSGNEEENNKTNSSLKSPPNKPTRKRIVINESAATPSENESVKKSNLEPLINTEKKIVSNDVPTKKGVKRKPNDELGKDEVNCKNMREVNKVGTDGFDSKFVKKQTEVKIPIMDPHQEGKKNEIAKKIISRSKETEKAKPIITTEIEDVGKTENVLPKSNETNKTCSTVNKISIQENSISTTKDFKRTSLLTAPSPKRKKICLCNSKTCNCQASTSKSVSPRHTRRYSSEINSKDSDNMARTPSENQKIREDSDNITNKYAGAEKESLLHKQSQDTNKEEKNCIGNNSSSLLEDGSSGVKKKRGRPFKKKEIEVSSVTQDQPSQCQASTSADDQDSTKSNCLTGTVELQETSKWEVEKTPPKPVIDGSRSPVVKLFKLDLSPEKSDSRGKEQTNLVEESSESINRKTLRSPEMKTIGSPKHLKKHQDCEEKSAVKQDKSENSVNRKKNRQKHKFLNKIDLFANETNKTDSNTISDKQICSCKETICNCSSACDKPSHSPHSINECNKDLTTCQDAENMSVSLKEPCLSSDTLKGQQLQDNKVPKLKNSYLSHSKRKKKCLCNEKPCVCRVLDNGSTLPRLTRRSSAEIKPSLDDNKNARQKLTTITENDSGKVDNKSIPNPTDEEGKTVRDIRPEGKTSAECEAKSIPDRQMQVTLENNVIDYTQIQELVEGEHQIRSRMCSNLKERLDQHIDQAKNELTEWLTGKVEEIFESFTKKVIEVKKEILNNILKR